MLLLSVKQQALDRSKGLNMHCSPIIDELYRWIFQQADFFGGVE